MSAENKKLLWISVAVCVFVLVLALAALFLFAPRKAGGDAPATIGDLAAPKASDPRDFLDLPPPPPVLEAPADKDGDIIVIYGDKPASIGPAPAPIPGSVPGSAPAPAASAPQASAKPAASATPKPAASPAPAAPAAAKSAAKPVSVTEYWIQAASFASRGRADELKESLATKGISAVIAVKDIDGKSWYRVRIGPYGTQQEAGGWLGKVKALPGCAEAYVSKSTALRQP